MNERQVIDLMKASKNEQEWNRNCNTVKKNCGGYPPFWYQKIIMSGLCDQVLGAGASQIKVIPISFK